MVLPTLLSECRVAIFGLGMMGGSLALKLRGNCLDLFGCDPDPHVLSLARKRGLVAMSSTGNDGLVAEADILILAVPVGEIIKLLEKLPTMHPGHAVVLDIGSTKIQIMEKMRNLPPRFDPVGGHPMCGKERGGIENADAELYSSSPFALVPIPRTTSRALALVEQLVRCLGASQIWLDAETHDQWVAATSHVPFLISNALAAVTPLDTRPLIGPGWRSTTRLAPTQWAMIGDVIESNRSNILSCLKSFRCQIQAMEELLAKGDLQGLKKLTEKGAENYETLTR